MSEPNGKLLNPQDARLFRITHVDNVPWLLDHGLHAPSSLTRDPNFVPIGMATLIDRRTTRRVPIAPGGVLADYVPFYFTPWSMMLKNISTGFNGVTKRANAEIVIVGARLPHLRAQGLPVIFTDGHAYMRQTEFYDEVEQLQQIDWAILRARNFWRDDADPDKSRRYQAEALVHRHVPTVALAAIACYDEVARARVAGWVRARGLDTIVTTQPQWYF